MQFAKWRRCGPLIFHFAFPILHFHFCRFSTFSAFSAPLREFVLSLVKQKEGDPLRAERYGDSRFGRSRPLE